MTNLTVYTDGAYSSTRNQGGVGIVFVKNDKIIYEYSKCIQKTTNNRCELIAVIKACQELEDIYNFPFDPTNEANFNNT